MAKAFGDEMKSDLKHVKFQGMEKCKELGLAKSIGVSNYNVSQLERILAKCKVPPANNQVIS